MPIRLAVGFLGFLLSLLLVPELLPDLLPYLSLVVLPAHAPGLLPDPQGVAPVYDWGSLLTCLYRQEKSNQSPE